MAIKCIYIQYLLLYSSSSFIVTVYFSLWDSNCIPMDKELTENDACRYWK